jgi:hypothetical protein
VEELIKSIQSKSTLSKRSLSPYFIADFLPPREEMKSSLVIIVLICVSLLETYGAVFATADSAGAEATGASSEGGGGGGIATAGLLDEEGRNSFASDRDDPAARRSAAFGCSTAAEQPKTALAESLAVPASENGEDEEVRRDPLRRLAGDVFFVNTTDAPASVGNPSPGCATYTACINNCRSLFYEVIGTGGSITASSCEVAATTFVQQLYVWEGESCANFTCISTFSARAHRPCPSKRQAVLCWMCLPTRCPEPYTSVRLTHMLVVRLWFFVVPIVHHHSHAAAARTFGCPGEDSGNTFVTLESDLGVTYHVQMTSVGPDDAGTTTLTFTGSIDPVVTEVEGECVACWILREAGAEMSKSRGRPGGTSSAGKAVPHPPFSSARTMTQRASGTGRRCRRNIRPNRPRSVRPTSPRRHRPLRVPLEPPTGRTVPPPPALRLGASSTTPPRASPPRTTSRSVPAATTRPYLSTRLVHPSRSVW